MNWLEEYKASLKMPEVEEVTDLLIYRPLAFLLVISVYRTTIKPDHLTLAAMTMGIAGGCFYAYGTPSSYVAGAVFYILFNILDCSDGQLARMKKNGTSFGRLLDGIADYIAAIAVYTGIAIGYSGNRERPALIVLITLLAGLSIIVQESLVDYFRTRFLDIVLKRKNTFNEGLAEFKEEYETIKNEKGNWFKKTIVLIYLNYSRLQKIITSRKKSVGLFNATPEEYYNKNRLIIRFWVLMGPSAKITVLVVCSFFGRFDIFFWTVIAGLNILGVILWIIQYYIDKSFETQDR
jgi:phosphatidylglycerophosphate synthase